MVEQGDVIFVSAIDTPLLVVSKNVYNQSGFAVVCPILKKKASDLCTECAWKTGKGFAQSDNLRLLNLHNRSYSIKGNVGMANLLCVLSCISAIFDIV